MSWYRELAGDQTFRCTECGKRKRVKYVPVSGLCRSCAAKKAALTRRRVSNIPVSLNENLVVTKAVERRLRKKAQSEIPATSAEKVGNAISRWSVLVFWASSYFIAHAISPEFSGLFWLVLLGWALGGPLVLMYAIDLVLSKPRKERAERIALRVTDLAEDRRRIIEEAMRFYSSPEWAMIRQQVIDEDGRICSECKKLIKNDNDVTVDHKRPRSRYPDLALTRDNLRVLCRACNSEKGAREWLEF